VISNNKNYESFKIKKFKLNARDLYLNNLHNLQKDTKLTKISDK